MPALTPRRRKRTAKEIAAEVGLSERTVVRAVAEPRADYERRARERRATAIELRLQGLTYRQIAERTGDGTGTVGQLLAHARRNGEWAAAQAAAGMTSASDDVPHPVLAVAWWASVETAAAEGSVARPVEAQVCFLICRFGGCCRGERRISGDIFGAVVCGCLVMSGVGPWSGFRVCV